jgi:hypothetical protein
MEAVNEVLLDSEIGIESDTGTSDGKRKLKFGDGITRWNDLPYYNTPVVHDDVTITTGGTLKLRAFDAKGRLSQEDNATTSDLPEGDNLYFTDARARAAGGGEILVADGVNAPPVMLTNEAEDDFIYQG